MNPNNAQTKHLKLERCTLYWATWDTMEEHIPHTKVRGVIWYRYYTLVGFVCFILQAVFSPSLVGHSWQAIIVSWESLVFQWPLTLFDASLSSSFPLTLHHNRDFCQTTNMCFSSFFFIICTAIVCFVSCSWWISTCYWRSLLPPSTAAMFGWGQPPLNQGERQFLVNYNCLLFFDCILLMSKHLKSQMCWWLMIEQFCFDTLTKGNQWRQTVVQSLHGIFVSSKVNSTEWQARCVVFRWIYSNIYSQDCNQVVQGCSVLHVILTATALQSQWKWLYHKMMQKTIKSLFSSLREFGEDNVSQRESTICAPSANMMRLVNDQ